MPGDCARLPLWRALGVPVLALLLLTTAACGRVPTRKLDLPPDPTGSPDPGRDVTTIRVLSAGPSMEMDALIAAYYAKYGNVRVEKVAYTPGDQPFNAFAKAQIEAGAVDVLIDYDQVTMVKEKLLLPLDPYIEKSRMDLNPFGPPLDQLRQDGKLYVLPYSVSPFVVAYNVDLFQAAGVPLPLPGWTWNQLRETARRLTKSSGAVPQWGFGASMPELMVDPFMLQLTGGNSGFKDEAIFKQALQYFSTLAISDKSMPKAAKRDWLTGTPPDSQNTPTFWNGQVAMSFEQLQNVTGGNRNVKFKWDVVPLPLAPGFPATAVGYPASYAIAATSKQPDAAWQFISFVAGPEAAPALARMGRIPFYTTPAVKQAWLEGRSSALPGAQSLLGSDWLFPAPAGADETDYRVAYNTINQVLSGTKTVEEALAEYRMHTK